jgi:hypothetical protein
LRQVSYMLLLNLQLKPTMFTLNRLFAAFVLSAAAIGSVQAASSSKTFTLANTGDGALTVSGAEVSGNSVEFALTGNSCGTVAAGDTCALTVTFTPNEDGPRPPATLQFNSDGSNGPSHSIALSGVGDKEQVVTLSANAVDVNMASLFGNLTAAKRYTLVINPGVTVTASSTATSALVSGMFPTGSVVKLVNHGSILGKGGKGGRGGSISYSYTPSPTATWCYAQPVVPEPGQPGGPAVVLQYPVSIDNSTGRIFGGGGGGGGSDGAMMSYTCGAGGSGGGGGAGGADGGIGGTSSGLAPNHGCSLVYSAVDEGYIGTGSWGSASNKAGNPGLAAPIEGGAGAGGAEIPVAVGYPGEDTIVGSGGPGGAHGEAGQAGATSYQFTTAVHGCTNGAQYAGYSSIGAPGGAGGPAITTNGNAVTWLSNGQVLGAVQ